MDRELVGKVAHYYGKLGVAVIELSAGLKEGDRIVIEKGDSSFEQTVSSMQIEKSKIENAKAGQAIGMKVDQPVREGYEVYRVTG